ncbi:unnamed protein product [Didymodactylos carnosus]|uniref:Uncharacterized protein n=1 Tax=Didymodactylos carnosus TaxID=1234261 RepID=A0A8S2I8X4_9BILA|nr:unnamed protein product [Didymodactylos carnosus]CAF3716367.1 unnamed protein product [Didymodactylos carnosus]
MNTDEENKLNECLNLIIEKVCEVLTQLKSKQESTTSETDLSIAIPTTTQRTTITTTDDNDLLLDNSIQNNNVNTFTVDNDENDLLDTLTNDLQNILKHRLPELSKLFFTQRLTATILYTLKHNLKGLLLAVKAYPAALNGDLTTVQGFLKRYRDYKDKSGFWGTTLLYSAARNNHMQLVRYLIETVGCSVNAQNQGDINYILVTDNDNARPDPNTLGYDPDPKASSTALHAACFNNNLNIAKYLIDKGANYLLRNQLGETPIENGEGHQQIRDFFKDYLVLTYTNLPNASIPSEPILDCHDRVPNNCVWEYKPVKGFEWEEFTKSEHDT